MYVIRWDGDTRKLLDAFDHAARRTIERGIAKIAEHGPKTLGDTITRLKGPNNTEVWRCRSGDYRIVFRPIDQQSIWPAPVLCAR